RRRRPARVAPPAGGAPRVHLPRREPERRGEEPPARRQTRGRPAGPAQPGPGVPGLHRRRPADEASAPGLAVAAARPGPRRFRAGHRPVRVLRPPAHAAGARRSDGPVDGPYPGTTPPPAEGPRMSTTQELTRKHCVPCEGGIPPLPPDQVRAYLKG